MNTWRSHQTHVLEELRRASDERAAIAKDLIMVRIEVAKLKVQASIWGAAAGVAAGAMTAVISALLGG